MEFVTQATMNAEVPGAYDLLPPQFRDRIPAYVTTPAEHAEVFRKGFSFSSAFVDNLFARLRYAEGQRWPMWKLMAAFYLVQSEVGSQTLRQVGAQMYETVPWPPNITNVADAIVFTDNAYRSHHSGAPRDLVGGWITELREPGRLITVNATPYPCHLEEGVLEGICRAFPAQRAIHRIIDLERSKRRGGQTTRYEVTFTEPVRSIGPRDARTR